MKLLILYLVGTILLMRRSFGQTTGQTTDMTTAGTTQSPYIEPCHGEWSDWSKCFPGTVSDPTSFQDRIYILHPSQHEATTCDTPYPVNFIQTRPCTTLEQPIEDLPSTICKDEEFQCTNYRCIPLNYQCNGDDDCDDNTDEFPSRKANCTEPDKLRVCGLSQEPGNSAAVPLGERYLTGIPGIQEFAAGIDILTGNFRGNVLSMSGHGSCRKVLISGVTDSYYRLPQNVASLRQTYDITVGSGRIIGSGAALLNDTKNALKFNLNFGGQILDLDGRTGFTQSDFVQGIVTESLADDQERLYASVDSTITTAEILLKEASSLEVTTEFMSRLFELPYSNFSNSMYMNLIQDYGTHYVTGGNLGGIFRDTEVYSKCWLDSTNYEEFSSRPWRETVIECARQSFFTRLTPDTSTLSNDCKVTAGGTTKTIREETVDKYAFVAGGSVDTSSNLKFSFEKTTWDEWIQTIVNGPVLDKKNFKLEKISNLVWSSSFEMNNTRRQMIEQHINYAIELYLSPYDAETLCEKCEPLDTGLTDYNDEGEDDIIYNYGVAYVTGTGADYKCHCVYDLPQLEATCGALQNMATLLTLLMSLMAVFWNTNGN